MSRMLLKLKIINSIYFHFFSHFYFLILNLGLEVSMMSQLVTQHNNVSLLWSCVYMSYGRIKKILE